MRAQKKKKDFTPVKITPDMLQGLQNALNDSIKPDFKEKKDGNAPKKKRRNRKPKTKEEK